MKVLTGRTRYRALRLPFSRRTVLVLQVEERQTGINPGTHPNDARSYDVNVWRDAKVEDLTYNLLAPAQDGQM